MTKYKCEENEKKFCDQVHVLKKSLSLWNDIYLCMLKKYHIDSVFKLPMLYHDICGTSMVDVFFFWENC